MSEPSMYQLPPEFMTAPPVAEALATPSPVAAIELAREAVFSTIVERDPTPEQLAAIQHHIQIISELKQLRKDDFGLAA